MKKEESKLDWMGIKIKPMDLKDIMKERHIKQEKASEWISVKGGGAEKNTNIGFSDN